jgi:hypothetical protein
MAVQTIVQGPLHFGDTPAAGGDFQGVAFVGLARTFPLELIGIDADNLKLSIYTRDMEILGGGPGHQVLINNTRIGYLNNPGALGVDTLPLTRAGLSALLGADNQIQLTIQVEDIGGGLDDDFILDRIDADGFRTGPVPQPEVPVQPATPGAAQPAAKPAPNSEISITVVPDAAAPASQRLTNIPWQSGTTILSAMILADALSPFTLTFRVLFASTAGAMIDMIDGVEEHDTLYWIPRLNGQLVDLGVSTTLVPGGPGAPNAAIEWRRESVTAGHPAFDYVTRKAQLKKQLFRG